MYSPDLNLFVNITIEFQNNYIIKKQNKKHTRLYILFGNTKEVDEKNKFFKFLSLLDELNINFLINSFCRREIVN